MSFRFPKVCLYNYSEEDYLFIIFTFLPSPGPVYRLNMFGPCLWHYCRVQQTGQIDRQMGGTQHRLLDRDDILKISYSVRKAGNPAYTSLSPLPWRTWRSEICTLSNRLYLQNNLYFEYRLCLAILLCYFRKSMCHVTYIWCYGVWNLLRY